MPDPIQKVIHNLLDEAVEAASQSEWAVAARICGEIIKIDGDNAEAVQLLKAAEFNLQEPSAKSDFIDLADRTKWAKYTISAAVVSMIVLFIAAVFHLNLMLDIERNERAYYFDTSKVEPISQERIDRGDFFNILAVGLHYLTFVISIIVFLFWIKSSYRNLSIIGAVHTSCSPRWAVIWWFVPIFHLFMPYRTISELWWVSHTAVQRSYNSKNVWPAGCFFAAHIIGTGLFLLRGVLNANEMINQQQLTWFTLFGSVFSALAGSILFLFVHKVSIAQQSWFRTPNKVRRPDSAP